MAVILHMIASNTFSTKMGFIPIFHMLFLNVPIGTFQIQMQMHAIFKS